MKLRQVINRAQQNGELDALMAETLAQLSEADRLQNESTLSGGTLFTASLIILLREGLEALLVIIALMTVLIRTQRQDALKYVHTGWIVALLSGGATWVAAQSLISISGASREVMEGVAALFAALVLFYVGIWMHSKTHAAQWQAYIQKHVNERLKSGTLWGLAALSFIAVYREVFETVLFYESLLTQAAEAQYSVVAGGFLLGVAMLAVLSWVLIRYSIKLPIARFFSTTTYLLLALSFILTGKGISALQEAALIGMSPLPVNVDLSWIGLKSTWQGITAQALILVVFMVFIWGSKVKQRLRPSVSKAPGMKGLPVTASESD
jgi:high-affinity iron transporter